MFLKIFLPILLGVAITLVGIWYYTRRRGTAAVARVGDDPRGLKAGDLVDCRGSGETATVLGTIKCQDGLDGWEEHLLENKTGERCWLSVRVKDGNVKIFLWTALNESGLAPGLQAHIYNGVAYVLTERRIIGYTTMDTTGRNPNGYVDYSDYGGSNGTHLAV